MRSAVAGEVVYTYLPGRVYALPVLEPEHTVSQVPTHPSQVPTQQSLHDA